MPDSPVIITVLLVGAIVSISWNTASIGSLRPMMFENLWELCSARLSSTFSRCRCLRSSSFRTRSRSSLAALGDLWT